jgi:hypothetical protein
MPSLFVLAQTTTTEVRRVVGDPPPTWVPVTAGLSLLVAILLLGWIVNRRRER